MIAWLAAALTQAEAQEVIVVPDIPSQVFRPSLDTTRFTWVDDAVKANPGPLFGLTTQYGRAPLVYELHDQRDPLVRDLVWGDLTAGYAFGPVRVAAVVPVVGRATGVFGGETGLGDLALGSKVTIVSTKAVSVAVDGRLWVPTATVAAPVSAGKVSGEGAIDVSAEFGPVQLALNTGYRVLPTVILEGIPVDDAVTTRFGFGYGLSSAFGLTAELAAQAVVRSIDLSTTPVEALTGAYVHPRGPIGVKVAVGHGFTSAVGAPGLRAIVGVTYSSPAKGPVDSDRDGLIDTADRCPREPEDRDGWQDEDGCVEKPWVLAKLVDEQGAPLPSVRATLLGPNFEKSFTGSLEVEVEPGSYTLVAHDTGYADALTAVSISDGPPTSIELRLHPQRVTVTRERFDLDGEIFFETGSDVILGESWPLLDEVAAVLVSTPEIRRLRIEGHTDSIGTTDTNYVLSQRRAAAVRAYLVSHGIEPIRLVAIGYGEDRPMIEGEDDVALAANRRVEFVIELWEPIDRARSGGGR
ncbi:MAG: OmpA family protein [Myxococcota bacterium]